MQHKQYFAALLCGVLCLTGCLKNEESASVTQVRNAKTSEIQSVAALNNAKAAAETTLANAQAALMASEAKLNEAMAQKTIAEAEYQDALTKLEELRLQLLQLQIEEQAILNDQERVRLDQMKVQLQVDINDYERIVAQNQALIAAANTTIADEARKLENVAYQMELDALNYEAALLTAELAVYNAENALDAAEITYYGTILAAYNAALSRISTLYGLIATQQNNIINAQAGLIGAADTYEGVLEAQNDIIAKNQAKIDAIEKYSEMTKEELDAVKAELLPTVLEAVNEYEALKKAYNEMDVKVNGDLTAIPPVDGLKQRIAKEAAFSVDLKASGFVGWATGGKAYATTTATPDSKGAYWTNPETKAKEYFYEQEGTDKLTVYLPSEEEYKALEDAGYTAIGTYEPGYDAKTFTVIKAAKLNAENFANYTAVVEKEATGKKDDALKAAAKTRDTAIDAANAALETLNLNKTGMENYVATLKDTYGKALEEEKTAKAAAKAAQDEYDAIFAQTSAAMAGDHSIEEAEKAEADAAAAVTDATTAAGKAVAAVGTTYTAMTDALKDKTGYVYQDNDGKGYDYSPEWNYDRADFEYKKNMVGGQGELDNFDTAIDDLKKHKGYKAAKADFEDAESKLEAGKKKLDDLKGAAEQAELAWIKAGKPASGSVHTAYIDAQTEYTTQYGKVYGPGNLQATYDGAKALWEVNDPYSDPTYPLLATDLCEGKVVVDAAQPGWKGALAWLETSKATKQKTVSEGTAAYDKWAADAKKAIKAYEDALANVTTTAEAVKAANKAYDAAKENTTDVKTAKAVTEQPAVKDAADKLKAANKASTNAQNAVADFKATYPKYESNVEALAMKKGDAGWVAGNINFDIAAENAKIAAANKKYDETDAPAANKILSDAQKDIKKYADELAGIEGERGAYDALIKQYNEALPALGEAWKAQELAKAVYDAYKVEYDALVTPIYYDENDTPQDVNKAIETAEKNIETAEKAIDTAYDNLLKANNTQEAAIDAAEELIAQYEDEIAYQETLVEYYGAILAEFVAAEEEEVPAE